MLWREETAPWVCRRLLRSAGEVSRMAGRRVLARVQPSMFRTESTITQTAIAFPANGDPTSSAISPSTASAAVTEGTTGVEMLVSANTVVVPHGPLETTHASFISNRGIIRHAHGMLRGRRELHWRRRLSRRHDAPWGLHRCCQVERMMLWHVEAVHVLLQRGSSLRSRLRRC